MSSCSAETSGSVREASTTPTGQQLTDEVHVQHTQTRTYARNNTHEGI